MYSLPGALGRGAVVVFGEDLGASENRNDGIATADFLDAPGPYYKYFTNRYPRTPTVHMPKKILARTCIAFRSRGSFCVRTYQPLASTVAAAPKPRNMPTTCRKVSASRLKIVLPPGSVATA